MTFKTENPERHTSRVKCTSESLKRQELSHRNESTPAPKYREAKRIEKIDEIGKTEYNLIKFEWQTPEPKVAKILKK